MVEVNLIGCHWEGLIMPPAQPFAPWRTDSRMPGGERLDGIGVRLTASYALATAGRTRAGVLSALALALGEFGWSDARYWVRMQASYDLARERCKRAVEIPATPGGPL